MTGCHGLLSRHHAGISGYLGRPSGGRPLGRRHDEGGWRPECRWLEYRVVDGIYVRRDVNAVCGLLSLEVVVLRIYLLLPQKCRTDLGRPQSAFPIMVLFRLRM